MDKEILFRGKSKFGDKWIYGSLYNGYDWADFIIENPGFEHRVQVNPETIGQYIMDDQKGNKIFHGDILKCLDPNDEETEYITTFTASLAHGISFSNIDMMRSLHIYEYDWPASMEVIGNIHDNPELIEKEATND